MTWTKLKALLFTLTATLVVLGYCASQWFAFNGRAPEYARAVDVPSVSALSLVLLIAFIVMGFVKEEKEV